MAGGMVAFFNASVRMGIEVVLDAVRFDRLLKRADVVFTGEGKMDSQSLQGKVISGVAKRAKAKGLFGCKCAYRPLYACRQFKEPNGKCRAKRRPRVLPCHRAHALCNRRKERDKARDLKRRGKAVPYRPCKLAVEGRRGRGGGGGVDRCFKIAPKEFYTNARDRAGE